jgi:hypothetical protein
VLNYRYLVRPPRTQEFILSCTSPSQRTETLPSFLLYFEIYFSGSTSALCDASSGKMRRFWHSTTSTGWLLASLVSSEAFTPKHEAGRCAIRGSCGGGSFFSPALPCPDNGLAKEPEEDVRKQLVELCGPKWNTGPVCCEGEQVIYSNAASTIC